MAGDRSASPASDTVDDDGGSSSDDATLPAAIGKYLVIGRFPRPARRTSSGLSILGSSKTGAEALLTPVRPDGRCEIIEEGKILSELDHPNLVRVYDSDFLVIGPTS